MDTSNKKRTIDGIDLLNFFHSGAKEVDSHKTYLNSINVFPVADGDTGTNLVVTLRAMIDHTRGIPSFSSMINGISESGLASARGNSGIIFASYINGMAINGSTYDSVGLKEFSVIAKNAVDHLYQSIEKPVEGTMITVIRAWADFLSHNHERFDSFQELFEAAYHTANKALDETTAQLAILKKHKVVDSGAAGFVRFLNGINHFFTGEHSKDQEPAELFLDTFPIDMEKEYPYCTEILMSSVESDTETLKSILSEYGDSLVVSSSNQNVKIHIHTDRPEKVVESLREKGNILSQKVDDTRLQNSVHSNKRHKIGIITDSIADLPEEFKLEHQIHTIPLGIILDDVVYLDKQTIQTKQLFREIHFAKTYPTSSQPEPSRIKDVLEELIDLYESLIVITVSDKLSGTFKACKQELNRIDTKGKNVSLIDSRLNSGAEGLIVFKAAMLLDEGLDHDAVVKALEAMIPKTKIYVCLETIENAVRGGRISNSVGKVGMKIGLRPIMTLDAAGKGATFGAGLSQKSLTKKIEALVQKTMAQKGISSYCIVHAENLELALEYKEQLSKIIGKEPLYVTGISSVIAIHSGPGSVAVCLTEES